MTMDFQRQRNNLKDRENEEHIENDPHKKTI